MSQYTGIGQKSDGSISDIRDSCQSFLKENYDTSRTSDDIDTKFGPVTKADKKNKARPKKFGDDVMSENCDITVK